MRQQLEHRLRELKAEFQVGQEKLAEIEAQAVDIRNTLLRISGAIQVLDEELGKPATPAAPGLESFVTAANDAA